MKKVLVLGEYQVAWDGKDDFGAVLPPGNYLLNVEASRENGGHSYRRVPFKLAVGRQTFAEQGEGERLGTSAQR